MFSLKNIFFLKKKNNYFTGVLLDKRSQESKNFDVQFKEIVAKSNIVKWEAKTNLRMFPEMNQYNTYSCVAHSFSKCLSIYYNEKYGDYVKFSPAYIYTLRSNKPSEGMYAYDAWRILKENGDVLFDLLPTPKTENEINNLQIKNHLFDVGKVFKIDTEIVINNYNNIDEIASVIETTKKGVSVWYYFNGNEWSREVPVLLEKINLYNSPLRHAVVAVDYTLFNGKKALVIEDSAWFGNINRRIITEDFHRLRCFYASYFMNFKFENNNQSKPSYYFNQDLYFGMTHKDVEVLQRILQYEGLFPSNVQITGYFGSITLEAVKKFQNKYGIQPVSGYVGEKTREKLNKLYS